MRVLRQPQDRFKSETSFSYLTSVSDPKQVRTKGKKIKKAAKKSLQTMLHGWRSIGCEALSGKKSRKY
jgi:hypothetical protein